MKAILLLLSFVVFGCMTGSDDKGPKVIGYSKSGACGYCGKATPFTDFEGFRTTKTKADTTTVFVYVKSAELNKRENFSSSRIGRGLAKAGTELLDEGGQCLTIHQTGKDTVALGSGTVEVDVPIEPCLPYLLDKDLP